MDADWTSQLIKNLRGAFGEGCELPIVFWNSNEAIAETRKVGGCFFQHLDAIRSGVPASFNATNIACGGGKYYTGYAPMPEFVPEFVSHKEKYKQSPEMVKEYCESLELTPASGKWLNFSRLDIFNGKMEVVEGLLFVANPDMISGLCSWAWYDDNSPLAVSSLFGSGCSSIIANAARENRKGGRSVFLALFDISVRPWIKPDELGFVIPGNRLREMCETLPKSCLFDAPAWQKIKKRLQG